MGTLSIILATMVTTYYSTAVVQAVFHRIFGHHKIVGQIYEAHCNGHHAKYASKNLQDQEWIESGHHVMWYYAIPLGLLAALIIIFLGIKVFVAHAIAVGLSIWLHIYLHEQFHIAGSFWERYLWFHRKREHHFGHHRDPKSNYAIVETWMDFFLTPHKRIKADGMSSSSKERMPGTINPPSHITKPAALQ